MTDASLPTVAVMARIPAAAGQRDALAGALQMALDNAQNEPGTRSYVLHADAADADVLWMYEVYDDQAALDHHMSTDGFKALGPAIRPFLAGRPELTFLTPLGGKGL